MNFLVIPKPNSALRKPKPPLGRQKPRNLAEWLETATWYLVPAAEARIRTEIEAHHTEAVKSHLEGGAGEAAAQAAALADLGDAHAASRRFRREHLTDQDAAAITGSIKLARGKGILTNYFLGVLFFALLVVITNFLLFFFDREPWQGHDYAEMFFANFTFLLLIVGLTVQRATQIPAGQKTTVALLRQIILLRAVGWVIFCALWLNICVSNDLGEARSHVLRDDFLIVRSTFTNAAPDPSLNGWLTGVHYLLMAFFSGWVLLIAGWFANQARHLFRLRQKLKTADEAELPPSDPAAAA